MSVALDIEPSEGALLLGPSLFFHVDGHPVPQGSHTAMRTGAHCTVIDQQNLTRRNKDGEITRKSGGLNRWREHVAAEAVAARGEDPIIDGPVLLRCRFRFERPPTHYLRSGKMSALGKRTTHPKRYDLSKLVRAVEDALSGNAYRDDIDVISYLPGTGKYWCRDHEAEGVTIAVRMAL